MSASAHFFVAAFNTWGVMLSDQHDRGWYRTFGMWVNGIFAVLNAAVGFSKVLL